eukprot:13875949-Alexandrium_andersonii.AAC.1
MAPKKGEAELLADVRSHKAWALENLSLLRGRTGDGFRHKLRQLSGGVERAAYTWYRKHGLAAAEYPRVAEELLSLDALVNLAEPDRPLSRESQGVVASGARG